MSRAARLRVAVRDASPRCVRGGSTVGTAQAFLVRLLQVVASERSMSPSVSTYHPPEGLREAEGPRRLAVACEEILERELVCRALRRLASDVHEASNGEELLELLLRRGPFDVVVTEGWMPRMSGEQALEAARAAGVETPFVVVIALSDAERTLTNSSRCLIKPLDLESLRAAVRALLLGPSPQP